MTIQQLPRFLAPLLALAAGSCQLLHLYRRPETATTGLYRISSLTGGLPIGDGGSAANARFNFPQGIAQDTAGNIYIADTQSHRIRRIAAGSNTVTTIAGRTRAHLLLITSRRLASFFLIQIWTCE